jgi:hypothetical protein
MVRLLPETGLPSALLHSVNNHFSECRTNNTPQKITTLRKVDFAEFKKIHSVKSHLTQGEDKTLGKHTCLPSVYFGTRQTLLFSECIVLTLDKKGLCRVPEKSTRETKIQITF